MEKKLLKIAVAAIDVDDDLYRVPSFCDLQPLTASLREIGLTNPLVLQRRDDDRFRIVCGFRRVEALLQLAVAEADAWILDEPTPSVDILLFSLLDNLALHAFNVVQVSFIIQKLSGFHVAKDDVIQCYLPKLGFGRNPKIYELYSTLHELPAEWQQALVDDHVPLDLAKSVVEMSPQDRSAFWRLIVELRLGKNRQRELLILLQDVARIQGVSPAQLLETKQIGEIPRMEKWTSSQKAERLKEWLWEKRYPHYVAIRKQFDDLVKGAACPPGFTLQHSPFFEGEELQIVFGFKSSEDYRAKIDFMERLLQSGHITQLTQLI